MMRVEVASRHDAWRGTFCHVPRHVLATSAGVPLNHATSAVVPRHHVWRGSVCPAMHGGGSKRPSFENIFINGSNLKKKSRHRPGALRDNNLI